MENQQDTESFYYVKSAIQTIQHYWYIFAISIIICLAGALFVNWYLQPSYVVGSVILIDEKQNNMPDPSQEFMKSFSIFTPISNIQQEILKMKSSELIYKALEKINAHVTYSVTNGIKRKELYDNGPFQIELTRNHPQPLGVLFQIIPKSENSFTLVVEKSEDLVQFFNYENKKVSSVGSFSMTQDFTYGDTIKSDKFCFSVILKKEELSSYPADSKYYFVFNDLNALTYIYQKALNIEQVAKDIHAASIKIKVTNPQKGIDFINALNAAYSQRNINKKNFVAENTIQYLGNQLNVIEDSLQLTERNLQRFRSSNKVMEIGAKADQMFKGAQELENQKAELQAKDKYYNYINDNLDKDKNGSNLLVPSSIGINDNVLTGIIEEYIKLNTERNNLIQNNQTQSPYFNGLTVKINNQKSTLSENIKYLISTNNLLLSSIEERLRKENNQISALPNTQRQLVGIERKYRLNDELYTYMLKKKEEAEVAKASNLPDNDILEPAKLLQPKPVSPNKTVNLALALVFGMLAPFFGLGIKSFMDGTVANEHMMLSLTNLPSLGRIFSKKGNKESITLIDTPKSAISESIRTVRTNLDYFLQGRRNQILLVTSTMSGEGKSFTALNLAISLALLDRKTVLVNFDMRKPNLYQPLKTENKLGTSSFLSGTASLEDILVSTHIPNFEFITAGEVPPNPSELIGSEKTALLLNTLKEQYDYVIIDTPPVGLVTEAFLLMRYADLKVFVVREKVTPKRQLSNLLKEIENKKIENLYWLLNDIDTRHTFYGKRNDYFTHN